MRTVNKSTRTLADVIREYDSAKRGEAEHNRFRNLSCLKDVIETASESRQENGKPYSHQGKTWNFWPAAIPQAKRSLVKNIDRFQSCASFDEILDLVTELASVVDGLGDLYCYDVALRIGAFLGCMPDKVYLHAGTLEGAKKLGLPTSKGYLEISELPTQLQQREAWEVEDILCGYAKACRHLKPTRSRIGC